jgi:hypothetical protein
MQKEFLIKPERYGIKAVGIGIPDFTDRPPQIF